MLFHCNPSTITKEQSMTTTTKTVTKTFTLQDIAFPKKCNVILLNDDVTPMNFVVEVLIGLFEHTTETAEDVMLYIHKTGKGVAGTYDPEVAEQKAYETQQLSRSKGFPLTVDIEQI